MEYEYEKEEFQRLSQTMGIGRKDKTRTMLVSLFLGRSYYNSLNQFVIEIEAQRIDIEHAFEYSKPVCFSSH